MPLSHPSLKKYCRELRYRRSSVSRRTRHWMRAQIPSRRLLTSTVSGNVLPQGRHFRRLATHRLCRICRNIYRPSTGYERPLYCNEAQPRFFQISTDREPPSPPYYLDSIILISSILFIGRYCDSCWQTRQSDPTIYPEHGPFDLRVKVLCTTLMEAELRPVPLR